MTNFGQLLCCGGASRALSCATALPPSVMRSGGLEPRSLSSMDPNCTSAQLQACVADLQEYFASAASPASRRRFVSRVDAANNLSDVLQELSGQESALAQHK